ncbi:putative All-trans-retinol 13,14-reductase [uncultured Desulfobacterium sp.]|uniref:Putative All-trans-retinol 13,14-reductase n=1 Tax=uncultured Desulfobacterium sp. TaxID=201089 RepID=A0A445MYH6_9BACT|nr:putative All-trans-retinol 13,14-reductase [uncultured Desulfobacterium sp.]
MGTFFNKRISRRDFIKITAATTAALTTDWNSVSAMAGAIGPKEKFPVVVIGAGLGGLSSAAIFARNGFPVTLIEQHDVPGGYATSFDREEGRFTFDVSLHATSGVAGGPMKEIFEETGILNKVEMVELPELCRIITPDYDMTWPQKKPEAVIEKLSGLFPAESNGIRDFFGQMMEILDEAMKPVDPDSWWDRLTFPITHRQMWAVRALTLGDMLDMHVRDQKLKCFLSAFWAYYGLPPSKLSGFLYAIATAAFMRFGGYYVRHRSQDLSNALVDAIEQSGGRVMLETQAVGIKMEEKAVSGVILSDGQMLPAGVVVSNASVPATMTMLAKDQALENYSDHAQTYLQRLKTYRPSLSTFIVWLGLNQEIRGKIKGYEIFCAPHYDPEAAYQAALSCDPERSGLGVTIYDNAFLGYSRPGTSTVTLIMISGYGPWRRFEADYLAERKEAYLKEKERIMEILISKAEQMVIPGLRSMIEVKEAATPLTNLRYTKNPEGAIYGYEQTLDNSFMNRIQSSTPFKGLYLASAWGGPGGGYEPCLDAGRKAFTAFVKDWEDEKI